MRQTSFAIKVSSQTDAAQGAAPAGHHIEVQQQQVQQFWGI
jgi:hypothetical protein